MAKSDVITFWQNFFTDLLTGTIKDLFIFIFSGLVLGMASVYFLHHFFIAEGSMWRWFIVPSALVWYGAFGIAHGLASCFALITYRKLSEMVGGLHDLLDLLSKEVIGKFSTFDKNITKEELSRKFDQFGQQFLEDLRLKKGLIYLPARVIYSTILRGLKYFFLNDIIAELEKKPSHEISSADIENAVRRVGVQLLLSPIQDNFILLQILNCAFMIITFGAPFYLFWKLAGS
jgi:hypothetical protein